MVRSRRPPLSLAPPPAAGLPGALDPARLPPPDAPERWAFLQQLRRGAPSLPAWLVAIEAGATPLLPDLLAALEDHLDAAASLCLLRCWLGDPSRDPALAARLGRHRDAAHASLLRQALHSLGLTPASAAAPCFDPLASQLPPLLGHQRCPEDLPLLSALALAPQPTPVRQAALEGLLLGLSAWPLPPLRATLRRLAGDHQPQLAAAAIDALARLPEPRAALLQLSERPLEPRLAARLQRRLRASPPAPLLLLVHGRAGGRIPSALRAIAAELCERRGAPVELLALSAGGVPAETAPAAAASAAASVEGAAAAGSRGEPWGPDRHPAGTTPLLVPLLLLPGQHVRSDLRAIAAMLRRRGPLRLRPFLGAWPLWQRALAEEADALAAAAGGVRPLLLHHPLEGSLPSRYLALLERRCAAECRASPYSSPEPAEPPLAIQRPVLPLALAASRLTEALEPRLGATAAAPLLQRPRLRSRLLTMLELLP